MVIWQAVTADDLELPIAQADSLKELSAMLDKSYLSMRKRKSKQLSGKQVGFRIYKVVINDDE